MERSPSCPVVEFLSRTFENVSRGLRDEHKILFALRLVQVRKTDDDNFNTFFTQLLKTASTIGVDIDPNILNGKLNEG